jgi:pantoate--beta-alanine ligase
MEIIKSPTKLTTTIKRLKGKGKKIGFVPTMGSLHNGHISLIKKTRKENDIVVLSIFVNPTQFGPKEDYKKYPRNLSRDSAIAKKAGVDIIFAPEVKDMYPVRSPHQRRGSRPWQFTSNGVNPTTRLRQGFGGQGFSTYIVEEELSKNLEGAIRPGHFKGVTTVVLKLFNIVQPDISYFGQKDWQQAVIITKMVKDLNLDTKIKVLPTIREKDGLAMSSRNAYLNKTERKTATILYRSLIEAKKLIANGSTDAGKVKKKLQAFMKKEKLVKIDYIEIRDPETLAPITKITNKVVILLAVRIGEVRLIDNMIIK